MSHSFGTFSSHASNNLFKVSVTFHDSNRFIETCLFSLLVSRVEIHVHKRMCKAASLCQESERMAKAALDAFRKLKDSIGIVKSLRVSASANVGMGRLPTTKRALEQLEEAQKLCQDLENVEEEAAV